MASRKRQTYQNEVKNLSTIAVFHLDSECEFIKDPNTKTGYSSNNYKSQTSRALRGILKRSQSQSAGNKHRLEAGKPTQSAVD